MERSDSKGEPGTRHWSASLGHSAPATRPFALEAANVYDRITGRTLGRVTLRSAPATQAAFPTTICDKSRWRSARSLYSPNLNLIERLWKFIKRRALYGRYQPTFAQFQATIQEVLDGLSTTHAEKLKSLMTLKFQRFEDVSLMAA